MDRRTNGRNVHLRLKHFLKGYFILYGIMTSDFFLGCQDNQNKQLQMFKATKATKSIGLDVVG